MTDQHNAGSTPRPTRPRTSRTPVVKDKPVDGRAHLVDALGEKTTGAIEALTRVVVAPLEERVKVLEGEKNEMERRLSELPATIEKSVLARLIAAQKASHEAWLGAVGIVRQAKEDIATAANGGPVTTEVGREAKDIVDEASDALKASERNFEQSLLEFDKLASRIKRVEDILEIQEDGKSKRLDAADAERTALRELLGFDPKTGQSSVVTSVAAHDTAIRLLNGAIGLQPDGSSKRIGDLTSVVNANARATMELQRPNRWLSPWFWTAVAVAAMVAGYSLGVWLLHWKWNGILEWTAFTALLVGCLAWIVNTIVTRRLAPHVQYAEANAAANVVNSPAETNPQWNDPADQLFRPQAPADATRVDASASAQASA